MAEDPACRSAEDARCDLERFYRHPSSKSAELLPEDVQPILLEPRVKPSSFPLYLGPTDLGGSADVTTLKDALSDLLATTGAEGIRSELDALVDHARRLTAAHAAPLDASRALDAAGRELAGASGKPSARINALLDALPAGARLLAASSQVPLHLLAHAASRQSAIVRNGDREVLRDLASRAAHLLRGERLGAPEPGRFALDEGRRERLAHAFHVLEGALAAHDSAPRHWLVHDGLHSVSGLESLSEGPEVWQALVRENPCAAAAELFDREAENCVELARAISRLELETSGVFDSARQEDTARQEDRLADRGWKDLEPHERQQLPLVVVLTSAEQIAQRGMAALSQLLRSGRPVQVVLTAEPLQPMGGEPVEARFEPLLFGLIHPRAVVQQSALAYPRHLARGIQHALDAHRPGLHLVALGDSRRVQAAVAGRGYPLAFHDPDAGRGWAARLDLSKNPANQADWPSSRSEPSHKNELVTFADAALLDRGWRGHFQRIPDHLEGGLAPLATVLSRGEREVGIPFIWCNLAGRPCRVAISRPLLVACRERLEIWRALQEMAGLRDR